MPYTPVFRLTTFVPPPHEAAVRAAIAEAGGATYGRYRGVFWTSGPGIEQYEPLAGSHPVSGTIGEVSYGASSMVLCLVEHDEGLLARVIAALRAAHPWEEPAIFVDECRAFVAHPGDG